MRLINADKFEVFSETLPDNLPSDSAHAYIDGMERVLDEIDSAPTIDAVQVVWCINCRYGWSFFDDTLPGGPYVLCGKPYAAPRETHKFNYFCADGMKKEVKDND